MDMKCPKGSFLGGERKGQVRYPHCADRSGDSDFLSRAVSASGQSAVAAPGRLASESRSNRRIRFRERRVDSAASYARILSVVKHRTTAT